MRYMEKGGFKQHELMRLTLSLSLLLLFCFWLTNFAMYFTHMGLNPQTVVTYYCGSDDGFQVAKSFAGLAEVSHFHFAIMAIVILMLTHLVIFTPWKKQVKTGIIIIAFASAFFQEASSWLVRFIDPAFAWLKVLSFVSLQAAMAVLMVSLGAYLWFWQKSHPDKNIDRLENQSG